MHEPRVHQDELIALELENQNLKNDNERLVRTLRLVQQASAEEVGVIEDAPPKRSDGADMSVDEPLVNGVDDASVIEPATASAVEEAIRGKDDEEISL